MSPRLLLSLLAALCLAGAPSAAIAQDDFPDDEMSFVEEDMWCDEEDFEDEFHEDEDDSDTAYEDEDDTELRQAGEPENPDEFFDEEDPDFLGPDPDDWDEEEPSDDDLYDDCAEDEDGDEESEDVLDTTTKKVAKKGVLTSSLYVAGKATITSTLTQGSSTGTARIAKRTVLGKARQRTAKAGTVSVRIKLTPKGRKVLRKAKRAVHLTLTSRIALASGKTTTRAKRIVVPRAKTKRP